MCVLTTWHSDCRPRVAIEPSRLAGEVEELDFLFYFIVIHLNVKSYMEPVATVLGSVHLDLISHGDNYKKGYFKNNYRCDF